MEKLCTSPKTVAADFINGLKSKKRTHLSLLLSDDGNFQIQDQLLNTIDVGKNLYLDWIMQRLATTNVKSVNYDACLYCKVGNLVILLNEGKFPRICKDDSERSKTGLMLQIKNGRIEEIMFCYTFRDTENEFNIELKGKKIKALIASGMSFSEAYRLACEEYPK